MDMLDKAERLRQCAQVTYEEAMEALEASGGDLLDAMILLEKQGKTAGPGKSVYSTSYQEQHEYIDVPDQVERQKKAAPTFRRSLANIFHFVIRFVMHTSFRVTRHGKQIFKLPSWIMVLAVLVFWKAALTVGLIALLFGFRYSFEGEGSTDAANTILSKAGDLAGGLAEDVRTGLHRRRNRKGDNT